MSSSSKEIFKFVNRDKLWQDLQDAKTDVGIRRGSRAFYYGAPNSGKSLLLFNKIVDSEPPYSKIYLYQASLASKEYADIDYIPVKNISDLPKPEEFPDPMKEKVLIILEDMDTIKKTDQELLDVIMRFSCSHCGVSVVMVLQNPYSAPVKLRRKGEVFVIFPYGLDMSIINSIPIPKEDKISLLNYFKKHGTQHDYITIDLALKDKYRFNNKVLTF